MKDSKAKINLHRDGTFSYRHLGHWCKNVTFIHSDIFLQMPTEIRRKIIYHGCKMGYDLVKNNNLT
jgi:hypothetical protein